MVSHLAACLVLASMWGCELVVDDGTRVLASADAGEDATSEAGLDGTPDVDERTADAAMPGPCTGRGPKAPNCGAPGSPGDH